MRYAALFLLTLRLSAATYYVTQSGAGTADGSTLGNAASVTTLNSHTASAGDIISLNGTITSAITIGSSGSSGNPVTCLFATGAKISGSPFSGSAITVTGNYVTVDGGTNGLIESLNNGTGLANQVDCTGVYVNSASNCTVKNLTVSPLYIRTGGTADTNSFGNGVFAGGSGNCNNLVVDHCTFANMVQGAICSFRTGATNVTYSNNTVSFTNWSLAIGDNNTTGNSLSGVRVFGNTCTNWANWEQTSNIFHHNGLFLFCDNSTGTITDIKIYGNTFGPGFGAQNTSAIYVNGGIGDLYIYNNLFLPAANEGPANGLITLRAMYYNNTCYVADNVFVQPGSGSCGLWMQIDFSGVVMTVNSQNNIFTGNWFYNAVLLPGSGTITYNGNHNIYYNTQHFGDAGGQETIAAWKGFGSNFDNDMITTDPKFFGGGSYQLLAGSPAIGAGINLSSLFTTDFNGVTRPASTAWDIGAYEYGAPVGATILNCFKFGNSASTGN
jgi:hypothetical protein